MPRRGISRRAAVAIVLTTGAGAAAWSLWPKAPILVGCVHLVDRLPPPISIATNTASETVHEWNFQAGAAGWSRARGNLSVATGASGLAVTVSGASTSASPDGSGQAIIGCAVDFETRQANAIAIRMAISSTLMPPRFLWSREGEKGISFERSVPFPVALDGAMHEYRVDLSEHPAWSGRIAWAGLFLSNLPGEVGIEWIRLERLALSTRLKLKHPGGSTPKTRIGSDMREAVLLLPGQKTGLDVDVPASGYIDVAFAVLGDDPSPTSVAEMEISVEALGRRAGLSQKCGGSSPVGVREWSDRRVDLASVAGKRARLEIRASGGEGTEWAAAFGSPTLVGERAPGPNLVLVSIDTLRADHVHAYGYERETTPSIDRLAAEGVRFADATSQAPHTLASHMSLMTSLWPSFHGVVQGTDRLRDGIETLAERLRGAGLRTEAIVEDGFVSAEFGFHRGFERYDDGAPGIEVTPTRAAATFAKAERALDRLAGERFFLFVHTYGPHSPYNAPEPYCSMFDPGYSGPVKPGFGQVPGLEFAAGRLKLDAADLHHVQALYDAGVRAADEALGRFLARLESLGLDRDTLVVVVSDHGEEFLDHKLSLATHGHTLYQELLHVPLVMRLPGVVPAGSVIQDPVALVDVGPTVLDLLGLPLPRDVQGENLAPLLAGKPAPQRLLYSQELLHTRQTALRVGNLKFIYMEGPGSHGLRRLLSEYPGMHAYFDSPGRKELYDLAADPKEATDLALGREADVRSFLSAVKDLLARGERFRRKASGETLHPVQSDLDERLKALGYAGAATEDPPQPEHEGSKGSR